MFEWLKILGLALGATFGLRLLVTLYDTFRDLREFGASFGDMTFYYSVLAPSFLSFVVPISVLVSLLYALGQFHRHNEITAMRTAGIGLFRITRWIWVLVVAISAVLFYLSGSVIPWSVEQARLIWDNLRFAHQAEARQSGDEVGIVYSVAYDNRAEGRLWHISRFSEYSHRAFGIQVSELDAQRRETRRVLAAEGYWDEVAREWVFFRGREIVFDAASGEIVRPRSFQQEKFPDLRDDPEWMLVLGKRPKDLSFFELQRILDSPETAGSPKWDAYAVRFQSLLAGTFSVLIVAGLAVPFAISGVRVNPAVNVSKSLGLFFLYYLLFALGTLLGEQGTVGPRLAAWLPNLFMASLAAWLTARAR